MLPQRTSETYSEGGLSGEAVVEGVYADQLLHIEYEREGMEIDIISVVDDCAGPTSHGAE